MYPQFSKYAGINCYFWGVEIRFGKNMHRCRSSYSFPSDNFSIDCQWNWTTTLRSQAQGHLVLYSLTAASSHILTDHPAISQRFLLRHFRLSNNINSHENWPPPISISLRVSSQWHIARSDRFRRYMWYDAGRGPKAKGLFRGHAEIISVTTIIQ